MSPHSLALPVATAQVVAGSGDTCVIQVLGTLDIHGVESVENELRWLVEHARCSEVVVDCTEVHFVDSSGLRLLIEAEMMAAGHGTQLHVRPSAHLRGILQVAGLPDLAIRD